METTSTVDAPQVQRASPRNRWKIRRWLAMLRHPAGNYAEAEAYFAPAPSPDAKPDKDTVDLIYESVRQQIEDQKAQVSALENKAVFVLGSASLLTAAASALQAIVISAHPPTGHSLQVVRGIEFLTLIAYVSVVFTAFMAYRMRTYGDPPNPRTVGKLLYADPVDAKFRLVKRMVPAFVRNDTTVKKKVQWTKAALIFLLAEAACLTIGASIQILMSD